MNQNEDFHDVAIAAAEALSLRYFGGPYPESCRLAVRDEMALVIEAALECVQIRTLRPRIEFSDN